MVLKAQRRGSADLRAVRGEQIRWTLWFDSECLHLLLSLQVFVAGAMDSDFGKDRPGNSPAAPGRWVPILISNDRPGVYSLTHSRSNVDDERSGQLARQLARRRRVCFLQCSFGDATGVTR